MNIEAFYKDKIKIKNPTEDFNKGKDDREIINAAVNNAINPHGGRIKRIHSFLRNMTASEKKAHNTLINRITEAGMDTAMGLDYILQVEWSSKQRIIVYRRRTDSELFYKIPKNPGFIESVLSEMLFIFINYPFNSEYAVVEGSDIYWEPALSKTNKNRIIAKSKGIKAPIRPKNLTYRNIKGIPQPSFLLLNDNAFPLIDYFKKRLA